MRRLESIRLSLLALVSLAGCAVDPTASLDRELSANKGRGGGGGGGGGGGAIASIQIAPANPRVLVGDDLQFVATAYDAEGKAVAATVTWTSSRPQSLGLNGRTGLAVGKALDETVVVSATVGGISTSVTVPVRRLTSLSLEVPESALIVGDQMRVRSVLVDNMAEEWPDEPVTWAVDMPQLVLLTGAGVQRDLSFEQPGTLTLSVSALGFATQSVLNIAGWTSIALNGWYSPCGITTTGEGLCWGDNSYGQNGTGPITQPLSWLRPVPIRGGFRWQSLATGGSTCGLTLTGEAYCWGANSSGQAGIGTFSPMETEPRLVTSPDGLSWSAVGGSSCGVTAAGTGYCWGNNWGGNVGVGTLGGNFSSPTAVVGGLQWASIGTQCGVTPAGVGYCWGENYNGVLGIGVGGFDALGQELPTSRVATPTPIAGNHLWDGIWRASSHACGVTPTGDGYCWGDNFNNQLGTSEACTPIPGQARCITPYPASISVQAGPWKKVAAGDYFTCGLTTSGTAHCWGRGPAAPSGQWSDIDAGAAGLACAIKAADRSLYCWSANNSWGLGGSNNPTRIGRTL